MGILSRLKRGWTIGIRSVRLLLDEPELLGFPVLGMLTLVLLAVFGLLVAPVAGLAAASAVRAGVPAVVPLAVGVFVAAFCVTTVSTFFSAGLVHAAAVAFAGEDPDLRDGLRAAWRVRRKVVIWGLIAASVAVVLRALERSGRVGWIVRAVIGVSWALATYFIVPVMVLDDSDIEGMFAGSVRTFRETWGETGGASVGVGVVFLVAVFGSLGLLVLALVVLPMTPATVTVAVLAYVGLLAVLYPAGQAVAGIVKTALYLYARDGRVPGAFDDVDLGAAFD